MEIKLQFELILKKLEMQERLEINEREGQEKLEREEKERQERLKKERLAFQHELEVKKLEVHMNLGLDPSNEYPNEKFNVVKFIKLVPPFQEADVDKYFCTLRK